MIRTTIRVLTLLAWTVGWLFITANAIWLVPQYFEQYPVPTTAGLAVWFAVSPVLVLFPRFYYQLTSACIFLAAMVFIIISTQRPFTTVDWWMFEGILYTGALIAWLFISVPYWRWMRGIVAVDDADT